MTPLDRMSDRWLRRYHPAPDAGPRLICFPHAGGSASFYHPFSVGLSDSTDVLVLQYPGRQDRRNEEGIDSVSRYADEIFLALKDRTDRPLSFFGHSMGAVLAYEVARKFEHELGITLLNFFASGRRAPSVFRPEDVHLKGDSALIAEIEQLSGTDSSLLVDDEMLKMILSAMRSDYKAIETYVHEPGPEPSCPISVLVGESDPRVTLDEARRWSEHSTGPFKFRSFPGGHFYLTPQQAEVIKAVSEDLASFVEGAA